MSSAVDLDPETASLMALLDGSSSPIKREEEYGYEGNQRSREWSTRASPGSVYAHRMGEAYGCE